MNALASSFLYAKDFFPLHLSKNNNTHIVRAHVILGYKVFSFFFFLGLEEGAVLPGMQRHLRSIKGETDVQVSTRNFGSTFSCT
jgi:hypothetical protein